MVIELTQQERQELYQHIIEHCPLQDNLYIGGSYANGFANEDSDIDVIYILPNEEPIPKYSIPNFKGKHIHLIYATDNTFRRRVNDVRYIYHFNLISLTDKPNINGVQEEIELYKQQFRGDRI